MSEIHFECPKCSQSIDAPQVLATQLIDCPSCNETIEVPARDRTKPPITSPSPPTPNVVKLTDIQNSSVASFLQVFAVFDFIGAVIGGFVGGDDNTLVGWLIFLSGVLSGLFLLGFASVIQSSFETAQRLRRIEFIIVKINEDKKAL